MGHSKGLEPGKVIEMGLLLLATPFLLFPTLFPVGTTLALVSLGVIWLRGGWGTGRFLSSTPFNLVLLLWLLAVLVGTLVSADPALTLPKLTGLLLGITVWRSLVLWIQTRTHMRLAVLGFLFAAAGMIASAALSLDWPTKLPFLATVVANLPDGFLLPESSPAGVQANQLAGTLLLSWPLSLAVAIWDRPQPSTLARLGRGVTLALAVGGALLLLLTQSRLGWLSGLASIGVLGWLNQIRYRGWPRACWLLPLIPGLGLLLAAVMPWIERWVMAQVVPGVDTPLETLAYRFEVWHYALEAVSNFPLTGTGLGTFRAVVLRLYPITVFPQPDVSHAHNVFVQVALDTGIPGLIAYLALIGLTLLMGWRWLRHTQAQEAGIAIGVMTCLIAFHLFGLGDTIAPGAKPGLLFWWLLGLAAASERVLRNQTQ